MKSTLQHLMLLGGIILLSATMMSAQDATEATAAGLYNDALELIKAKKYEEGLPILEEALAKAEANGNQQVIDLSKKNGAMAAYNLGNKKRKAKAYDEASALYSKGMEMNPGYSSNYIGMGRLLAAKGNQEEALAKYFEGAKIAKAEAKPKKEKEAYERAKSLISSNYKEDKYDKVITLGDAYVAEKKNAEVSYYIAKSLMATNKNEAAVPYLDDALSQSPEKKDKFIYAKGQALEAAGKNAEAVAAYKLITDAKYKESAQYKVKTLK